MRADEPTFEDLITWLDSHINYERTGMGSGGGSRDDPELRLRLLRMFLDIMDNPQEQFSSIHVTGTNGKTSTARMITSLLMAQGLRSGTYTSPHLDQLNERIAVNNEPVGRKDMHDLLLSLKLLEPMLATVAAREGESADDARTQLSYFELITSAAIRHFADAPVEVGVIEVGVGGKWDATNVIDADVAVITNVGLDHTNYLGPTRESIAEHKSGIVKQGAPVVIGERDTKLQSTFTSRTNADAYIIDKDFGVTNNRVAVGGRLIDLFTPGGRYDEVFISLHGAHQAENAAIALMAAEAFFGQPLSDEAVRNGFGAVTSPGRLEVVNRRPLTVIDGAHNVSGAESLVKSLDEEFAVDGKRIFVIGMLDPHDPAEILAALKVHNARLLIACAPDSPRAVPTAAIAEAAKSLGVPVVAVKSPAAAAKEALSSASEDDLVVITGSLYVAGAARTELLNH